MLVAGMAMAVAAAIDNLNVEKIIGSIAGDDTIMSACKTSEDANYVYEMLNNYLHFLIIYKKVQPLFFLKDLSNFLNFYYIVHFH